MSFIYDDEGNIIGEEVNFEPGPSPLGKFMGTNVDNLDDSFDQGWDPEPTAPVRQKLWDPEAAAALPIYRTLNLTDLDNLPDPEWIVKGFIPADAMSIVFGKPGSTKSFWVLDLVCCIAAGHPFNGAEVKQGSVLLAVGEGLRGMKWRIEAWKLAHPDADLDALNRNLVIVPKAVMLLDKNEAAMLVNTADALNQVAPLRAFVIDTWARSLTGGYENSAQDTGIAINVCETVRARTGASPLIVHHTGADGTRERGSTALRGATDTSIYMEHDDTEGIVTVTCKKMKDGEPFAPIRYELKTYGHSIVLTPSTSSAQSQAPNGLGYAKAPEVRDRDYWRNQAQVKKASPF